MKKVTLTLLSVVIIVILALIFSPHSNSVSNNPCSGTGCHGSRNYYQYLDILEGDSQNQIPSALNLNETRTVKVVIQNDVNTATYAILTNVAVTLTSARGHFSVTNPTVTIGNLPPGTTIATWQITAISDGYDLLTIQASAYNTHFSCLFSDYYSPSAEVTIGQPTATIEPTSTPTPTPTPTIPPATITPPTSTPAPTITPTIHPTTEPSPAPSTSNQTELSIQLLSPQKNGKLLANTKYEIEWKATGGTSPLYVTLEYTIGDSNQEWIEIGSDLLSAGKYSWTTPNNTSNYYIRVSVEDSSSPVHVTSITESFEAVNTTNPEVSIILVTFFLVVTVLIGGILVLRKRRKKSI